jgi:uncharacterized protein (TIGR00369 family)
MDAWAPNSKSEELYMELSETLAPAQVGRQARHWIEKVLAKSPFASPIGIEVISIEPERVGLRLPYRDALTTLGTVVHGGAIATLVDVAGSAASASATRDDDGAAGGAPASLTLSFIAPANGANFAAEVFGAPAEPHSNGFGCFCP